MFIHACIHTYTNMSAKTAHSLSQMTFVLFALLSLERFQSNYPCDAHLTSSSKRVRGRERRLMFAEEDSVSQCKRSPPTHTHAQTPFVSASDMLTYAHSIAYTPIHAQTFFWFSEQPERDSTKWNGYEPIANKLVKEPMQSAALSFSVLRVWVKDIYVCMYVCMHYKAIVCCELCLFASKLIHLYTRM